MTCSCQCFCAQAECSLSARLLRSYVEGVPDDLVPHRTFEGNRPTNVILGERLTPALRGRWWALYEHSVFHSRDDLEINRSDQWGVELKGALAKRIIPEPRARLRPGSLTTRRRMH